jgi:hypothetical protein
MNDMDIIRLLSASIGKSFDGSITELTLSELSDLLPMINSIDGFSGNFCV